MIRLGRLDSARCRRPCEARRESAGYGKTWSTDPVTDFPHISVTISGGGPEGRGWNIEQTQELTLQVGEVGLESLYELAAFIQAVPL